MRRLAILLLVLASVAGCGQSESPQPPPTTTTSEALPVALQTFSFGGDFTLTNAALRKPTSLADLRGKVVLLFFGYTMCPDACPLTMSKIAQAIAQTPGARDAVETVFITVDVDRDTPEVLARYVRIFGVPMIGLTGTRQQIDRVVSQYKASYTIAPSDSAGGPSISHSVYTYLIDRHGALRYVFRHTDSPDAIAAGIAAAMKES